MLNLAIAEMYIFKAHSVRSASVSAGDSAGVTINQTLDITDWSLESIFGDFTGHSKWFVPADSVKPDLFVTVLHTSMPLYRL